MKMTTPFPSASRRARWNSAVCLGCLVIGLAGMMGCRKPEPPPPTWVALVAESPIEPAALLQAWQQQQRATPTNLPAEIALGRLVDELAAYEQARRQGLLTNPEMQAAIRQLVVARYREAQQTNHLVPLEPTEGELRDLYAMQTNAWVRPLALNVALILLESPRTALPEKRQEARQTVAGWRQEILAGADPAKAFGAMAGERSADRATRYRRGELGWLTLVELGSRLGMDAVAAAEPLAVGALSEPVMTEQGVYLLRLVGRRPAEVKPFAEVEPLLRHRVREERRAQAETRFRREAHQGLTIRTNLPALHNLALPSSPANPPPAMPKN